jgi:DNA polymerase-3 subunit gamma/tau
MSEFVVSARKYRPLRFDDVVGQAHIAQTLKNAIRNQHLAHAFLFCGPRGVGKTTCARILARLLNCEQPTAENEPCGTCASCVAFSGNASFNIHELDAASNNSVEHIRLLVEQVRFQPQQGKYKVFIIDEVHMLSSAAFNAFLKTLEEPPPYAKFILATTEKHKILPTILSRCQIFDFHRMQIPDIVRHLQGIAADQHIEAAEDALHVIAQKADGAMRDALSIFDRIVSFSDKRISYQDVIANLNILDYDYYFKVIDTLLAEDVAGAWLLFDEILNMGFDSEIFVSGLAEHIRNLLVCRDPDTVKLLEVGDSVRERFKQQSAAAPSSLLVSALNLCNECDINYRQARNKRLHIETYLLKMCYIMRVVRFDPANIAPPGSQEKKNPDPVLTVAPTRTPATPEPTVSSGAAPVPTAPKSEALKGIASKYSGGTFKGLDTLHEEVKTLQKASEKELDAHTLTLEHATQCWSDFVAQHTDDTERSYYTQARITTDLDTHTFVITAQSSLAASHIRGNSALNTFIRNYFRRTDLVITIYAEAMPTETKVIAKTLTDSEKLKLMFEKNPAIEQLYKQFNLTFDR